MTSEANAQLRKHTRLQASLNLNNFVYIWQGSTHHTSPHKGLFHFGAHRSTKTSHEAHAKSYQISQTANQQDMLRVTIPAHRCVAASPFKFGNRYFWWCFVQTSDSTTSSAAVRKLWGDAALILLSFSYLEDRETYGRCFLGTDCACYLSLQPGLPECFLIINTWLVARRNASTSLFKMYVIVGIRIF